MRRAIALLLQHPEVGRLPDLPRGWEGLASPGVELLLELLQVAATQPDVSTAGLVERQQDPQIRGQLARLAVLDLGIVDDASEQFIGTLATLGREQRRQEREALLQKSRIESLSNEEKQRLRDLYTAPTDAPDDPPESGET
jgi:DNA primase